MKFNFLNKKAKTEENDMAEMIKGNIRYMIDFQTLPSLFFMEKQLFIENVENQRESFFADIFQLVCVSRTEVVSHDGSHSD